MTFCIAILHYMKRIVGKQSTTSKRSKAALKLSLSEEILWIKEELVFGVGANLRWDEVSSWYSYLLPLTGVCLCDQIQLPYVSGKNSCWFQQRRGLGPRGQQQSTTQPLAHCYPTPVVQRGQNKAKGSRVEPKDRKDSQAGYGHGEGRLSSGKQNLFNLNTTTTDLPIESD